MHMHIGNLNPGHCKIISYKIMHLLTWNAQESLDTDKSDAVMWSQRFFPLRERSSILLLAITIINSQPQKTRQTFHENEGLETLRQGL